MRQLSVAVLLISVSLRCRCRPDKSYRATLAISPRSAASRHHQAIILCFRVCHLGKLHRHNILNIEPIEPSRPKPRTRNPKPYLNQNPLGVTIITSPLGDDRMPEAWSPTRTRHRRKRRPLRCRSGCLCKVWGAVLGLRLTGITLLGPFSDETPKHPELLKPQPPKPPKP